MWYFARRSFRRLLAVVARAAELKWPIAAFAPVMRAYAVRRGCDEPDDAVQDVFVKFVAAIRVRTRAKASAGWRCSDRTRAIFEACTSGGLSAAEVVRAFGVSPGFVRIIRHRGRAREKKATHVA